MTHINEFKSLKTYLHFFTFISKDFLTEFFKKKNTLLEYFFKIFSNLFKSDIKNALFSFLWVRPNFNPLESGQKSLEFD